MGMKLTSTQVTGRNTRGENLASVSHCTHLKGTTQRLARKQDEGAEAAHSLTDLHGSPHPGLGLSLLLHGYF